jgi:parallel beta-helix repeat protein
MIKPGANATIDMVGAMVQALPGDVIQFDCGFFDLTSSLQLINTEDVLIKGCGKDKTVLSFKNNNAPEGILAVNVHGITIEDLTVLDTGGNGVELRSVDHGTLRRVRAMWSSGGGRESADPITAANFSSDSAKRLNVLCTKPAIHDPDAPESALLGGTTSPDYTVSRKTGRYGIYPVSSRNILVEESESVGASDAGIYIGQSNNAIIRKSRVAFNVFGFEIENVQHGEYASNVAECNTGGFLVYDLDGLTQYGDRTIMHDNISRKNNTYNFTAGGFVGNVPPGSGMITLSYDRIDIYDNEFSGNNTAGIIHTSYEIFPEGAGRPSEHRIDWYTEGLHIFRNKFFNNGNDVALPTSTALKNQDLAKLLPALVGLKNQVACLIPTNLAACVSTGAAVGPHGAHILWDGLLDTYHKDCAYPKDADGKPVAKDERGKPILTNQVPDPACHYNAYKFDTSKADAPRVKPDWFSCIDDDNQFSGDALPYANFHGTKGLEAVINSNVNPADPASVLTVLTALDPAALAQFPSDFDMTPHKCVAKYGKNLPPLAPVVIPPFVRSGDFDPAPSQAQIDKLCNAAVPAGQANFDAAPVNCPSLDQYHLFGNAADPTSAPNGGGVPFVLNTKLFSDYAVKYRVAFLPPGSKAVYKDAKTDGVNATLAFPTGTIIAKTFSFRNETANTEIPVETRLLIKRVNSKGQVRWDGMPYIWQAENGKRVAKLAMGGGIAAASWDLTDTDSGAHAAGSTSSYLIPNGAQCQSCHSNDNKEAGSSPIGPKVRFLNRPYKSESNVATEQSRHEVLGKNQLQYWCDKGLVAGCPADLGVDPVTQIATKLERAPTFNKPGDAGFTAGSDQDIEARARAYLEVNCEHCHNSHGFAGSTGFYLDSLRPVDLSYGICKRPTATGSEGRGGRTYDIHPGVASDSVMAFRTGPDATTPASRMPPLARSVAHKEGHDLLEQWIGTVIKADESKYPGSTSCAK